MTQVNSFMMYNHHNSPSTNTVPETPRLSTATSPSSAQSANTLSQTQAKSPMSDESTELHSANVDFVTLQKNFHKPITQVAKDLGVCATVLKKICRKMDIPRWPHRKLKSLDKMIDALEQKSFESPDEEKHRKTEILHLKRKREEIILNPKIIGPTYSHIVKPSVATPLPSPYSVHPSAVTASSSSSSSSSSTAFGQFTQNAIPPPQQQHHQQQQQPQQQPQQQQCSPFLFNFFGESTGDNVPSGTFSHPSSSSSNTSSGTMASFVTSSMSSTSATSSSGSMGLTSVAVSSPPSSHNNSPVQSPRKPFFIATERMISPREDLILTPLVMATTSASSASSASTKSVAPGTSPVLPLPETHKSLSGLSFASFSLNNNDPRPWTSPDIQLSLPSFPSSQPLSELASSTGFPSTSSFSSFSFCSSPSSSSPCSSGPNSARGLFGQPLFFSGPNSSSNTPRNNGSAQFASVSALPMSNPTAETTMGFFTSPSCSSTSSVCDLSEETVPMDDALCSTSSAQTSLPPITSFLYNEEQGRNTSSLPSPSSSSALPFGCARRTLDSSASSLFSSFAEDRRNGPQSLPHIEHVYFSLSQPAPKPFFP